MISRSDESARCAECGGPLRTEGFTTDGRGGLVQLVKPCARCRVVVVRRAAVVAPPAPAPAAPPPPRHGGNKLKAGRGPRGEPLCIKCGTEIPVTARGRRGGRQRVYCDRCAPAAVQRWRAAHA